VRRLVVVDRGQPLGPGHRPVAELDQLPDDGRYVQRPDDDWSPQVVINGLQMTLLSPPPDSRMAEPVQLSIWITVISDCRVV
jgi:hypothetical protein